MSAPPGDLGTDASATLTAGQIPQQKEHDSQELSTPLQSPRRQGTKMEAALGLRPTDIDRLGQDIMLRQDLAAPTLYQHGPGYGLASHDPHCLAVHAVLRVANVSFHVNNCDNENMSPTGELPFLRRCNDELVAGLENISAYIGDRRESDGNCVSTDAVADMRAYVNLVACKCGTAVDYELWCEDTNYVGVASKLYGQQRYPWPLSSVLCRMRQHQVRARALGSGVQCTPEHVYTHADSAFTALSAKLNDQPYLFGDTATEVDAVAYAYLAYILHAELPCEKLKPLVQKHGNLVHFCQRFRQAFFADAE
eukprot:m.391977 g.391977  ORF g.391977 m.391977 type:complete len:309 (-) comp21077_c0_seq11:2712-3638(-)